MKHILVTSLAILLSAATSLHASTGIISELKFPAGTAALSNSTYAIGISQSYIVVGVPNASYAATTGGAILSGAGEVQVFSATTMAFVRRIRPAAPVSGGNFGKNLCVQGSRAFVTHSMFSVLALDLTTGKTLWSHTPTSPPPLPDLKTAVVESLAIDGDALLIGMPESWVLNNPALGFYMFSGLVQQISASTGVVTANFNPSYPQEYGGFGSAVAVAGAVTVIGEDTYDYNGMEKSGKVTVNLNGTPTVQFVAPTTVANDSYGAAVAIAGNYILIGCPQRDQVGKTDAGAVYMYDKNTFVLVKEITAPAGTNFGQSLSASDSLVVIGAYGSTWLYDLTSGSLTSMVTSVPVAAGYGRAVGIFGTTVMALDYSAAGGTAQAGRVSRFTSVAGSWPTGGVIATTKKAAPGTPTGTNFHTLADISVLPVGKVMHTGTVSGGGTTTATNSGLWSNLSGPHELISRENQTFGSRKLSVPTKPLFTPDGKGVFLVRFTGGALEQNLFFDDGTVAFRTMGENSAMSVNGTQETIGKINEVVSCPMSSGLAMLAYSAKVGTAGVSTINDSRIGRLTNTMMVDEAREGQLSPVTGFNYGQMTARVASNGNRVAFVAALTGAPTTSNSALIVKTLGMSDAAAVARKGDPAPGAGTAKFSTFTSESISATDLIFRATLTGGASGVTSGIWRRFSSQVPVGTYLEAVAIRMQQAPGLATGVKFTNFLNTYIADGGAILIRAQVAGPGINTSNDVGVWLYSGNALHLIFRESDVIAGTHGLRIGTLQRFDMGGSSHYAALVTLVGASTTNNQAILTGNFTSTAAATWAPTLTVRKGSFIDRPLPMAIKSLSIAANHLDDTGSGTKGIAKQVCASGVIFSAQFADAKDLVLGKP